MMLVGRSIGFAREGGLVLEYAIEFQTATDSGWEGRALKEEGEG